MLISIGRTPKQTGDLFHHLYACHDRIRTFLRLAQTVGKGPDVPEEEIVDACLRIERYFTQALPLHVRDEEESLLPRVRGAVPELDRALLAMHEQHEDHELALELLLEASAALRSDPLAPDRLATLSAAAAELAPALTDHLRLEEASVFPALRHLLTENARQEILREIRARRE